MREMLERVAAAIRMAALHAGIDKPARDWSSEGEAIKMTYREIARAALAAIREPTNGMLVAAVDGFGKIPDLRDDLDLSEVWYAMIDAALNLKGEA